MKPNQRIITMIRVFLLLLAGIIFSIIAIVLSIGIAFNWSQKDNDNGEE